MSEFFRWYNMFKARNPLLSFELKSLPNKKNYSIEVSNAGTLIFNTFGEDLELMFALAKSSLLMHKKELI